MVRDLNDYYMDYLEHFGVKGMKWGVRREARRDAKESARAKMYYGEGAGVRRRNINAIVKQKSKDPTYKAEYEKAYAKQDLSKARRSAQRQRTVTDKTKGFSSRCWKGRTCNYQRGNCSCWIRSGYSSFSRY